MSITIKTNRIDIRLADEDKKIIEMAAKYNRQSISSYIISVVIRQAEMDLLKNETITLSNKERDIFLSALENPPTPNEALINLLKLWFSNQSKKSMLLC